jgi:hypothetical protein
MLALAMIASIVFIVYVLTTLAVLVTAMEALATITATANRKMVELLRPSLMTTPEPDRRSALPAPTRRTACRRRRAC